MRLAVSYGSHVIIPPVFGALGAAAGVAPVFWTCAMLLGGGAVLNRKSVAPSTSPRASDGEPARRRDRNQESK
jgi:hypothetical protein